MNIDVTVRMRRLWLAKPLLRLLVFLPISPCQLYRWFWVIAAPEWRIGNGRWKPLSSDPIVCEDDDQDGGIPVYQFMGSAN